MLTQACPTESANMLKVRVSKAHQAIDRLTSNNSDTYSSIWINTDN